MQKNKMVYFSIFTYAIAICFLLPFSLNASIHDQLTALEKKITSIENQLYNPFLTQPKLQNIELDIKIVRTKINLLQNGLRIENTNPFLPLMADEIEKKIQNLIINFNQKKKSFFINQLTKSLQSIQNNLFDQTKNYHTQVNQIMNRLVVLIATPPSVPPRSSSLQKKPAPLPAAKGFFEKSKEEHLATLEKKVEAAQEFGAQFFSTIAQKIEEMASLKELAVRPESEVKTKSLPTVLPSTKGTALNLLFRELRTVQETIIKAWSEKRSFLLLCTFLKPTLIMSPQETTQLDNELKKLNIMLENFVTTIVKKREMVGVKNKSAADLYHALVGIPSMVSCGLLQNDIAQLSQSHTIDGKNILTKLSWPKESLPLLQNILEQNEVALFLATEINKVVMQNVADIIFYSSMVDAAEIIAGKSQFFNSAKNHISSQACKIAIRVKDQALAVFNTLLKQLESSFPTTDKSREQLFAIVEATYTLRPLLLIQDRYFTTKDIHQIDLAIHSIQNGFMYLLDVTNKKSSKNNPSESDLQFLKQCLEQAISMVEQLSKSYKK